MQYFSIFSLFCLYPTYFIYDIICHIFNNLWILGISLLMFSAFVGAKPKSSEIWQNFPLLLISNFSSCWFLLSFHTNLIFFMITHIKILFSSQEWIIKIIIEMTRHFYILKYYIYYYRKVGLYICKIDMIDS